MGVQMFAGKFYQCNDPVTNERVNSSIVPNKLACIARNFSWVNPLINFDNVLHGYLALFQVVS